LAGWGNSPDHGSDHTDSSLITFFKVPSVSYWDSDISVILHRRSNHSLSWAMDGHIMCRGIIRSCQSAATSEVINFEFTHINSTIATTETFYLFSEFNDRVWSDQVAGKTLYPTEM